MMFYALCTLLNLGLCSLVYQMVLHHQKTFHFNRFFLLGSMILCLLAPSLEFNFFDSVPRINEFAPQFSEATSGKPDVLSGVTIETLQASSTTVYEILGWIYFAISICFLLRFLRNLFRLQQLTRTIHSRDGNLKLIISEDCPAISSFFNYVFLPAEVKEDQTLYHNVIAHERSNYRQLHALDIILMELLLCVFWFNPFLWLYKKYILQNHEYSADAYVIESGIDSETYSKAIIASAYQKHRMALSSGFNFTNIKKRILMLQQSKRSLLNRSLKISSALVLTFGIFMFSSFNAPAEPLVVVIDAAHGGKDSGNDVEKDVVLSISNMLAAYSNETIKIVTTRSTDKFLTLKERAAFVNEQHPDLMISLHCNGFRDASINGIEAYYFPDNVYQAASHAYSKTLIENQLNLFSARGEIKTAGFHILKNTQAPGVVLELGFITNESDRAVLTNKKQQQVIAKNLYENLVQIQKNK